MGQEILPFLIEVPEAALSDSVGGEPVAGAGECPQAGSGLPLAFFRRSVNDERPGGPGAEGR